MPLLLCHSPKGGVGTSFIAAQLAMHLARRGHAVTALDFTCQDSLKLFFGLRPAQMLPEMADAVCDATPGDTIMVQGVNIVSAYRFGQEPQWREPMARRGRSPFDGDRLFVADVASGDRAAMETLLPYALLHICPLLPCPAALAALTQVQTGTAALALPRTLFVLNQRDDRQRLSRHSHIFLRELFGAALIGTIRHDQAVNEAVAMFETADTYAPASVALADLATLAVAVEARCGLATTV